MKEQLVALWREISIRREDVLKIANEDNSQLQLKKQIYMLLANEYAGIMDALNTIISHAN